MVMSLVVLQALLPFVHAHFDTGSAAAQTSGLHMHAANASLSDQSNQYGGLIITADIQDMQIVDVDNGVLKDMELPVFSALCCLMLFVFVLTLNRKAIPYPAQVSLKPSPYHTKLSPRAPPYC